MLVEVLGNVRDVEVGVALVGELLELGVERFLATISIKKWRRGARGGLPERS